MHALRRLATAGAALIFLGLGGTSGWAADITPHRALYELTLDSARGRSNVTDVQGTMFFEWADSCDGWTVTQKLKLSVTYTTGEESDLGWNLVSWEAKDGLSYRFFMHRTDGEDADQELRGEAKLDGAGKAGVAHYTQPQVVDLKLPAGTMFPTQHSLSLIRAAKDSDLFTYAQVFDGSDVDGLFGVGSIIGHRLPKEDASKDRPEILTETPSWRFRLAFFPHSSNAAEPEHEQSFRMHRNGVVEDLLLDYGDFSVKSRIIKIEALPPSGC